MCIEVPANGPYNDQVSGEAVAEEELQSLKCAVAGDVEALSALLETHGASIRQQLSIDRKWSSVLDPEDVMQVTYLEAFLRIQQFQPASIGAFRVWLLRIAENNLRDALKELGRQKRPQPDRRIVPQTYDQSVASLTALLGVTITTPSQVAAGSENKSAVERALDELPPDYSRVIRLYDLQGLPVQQVAAELGRSPGAVHMLRNRAHEHLRELLGPDSRYFSRPA
jgi:RNA polymerase sigma-70 factor, ECF subfamily